MLRALAISTLLLAACGGKKSNPTPPANGSGSAPVANDCIKTGCSGIVCAEPGNDVMTTCEFKNEYACYQTASCERQADGKCGWTQTDALKACIANPPAP
jgi:eight-cysteine-cluster-containing protein